MSQQGEGETPLGETPRVRGRGRATLRDFMERLAYPFKRRGSTPPEQGPPLQIPEHESLSPIPQRRRSGAILDEPVNRRRSGAFVEHPPPFTSSPIKQGEFGGQSSRPSLLPRTMDTFGQPLGWAEKGAVSQITPAELGQEEEMSPTPMRRARSSAISSDAFARGRSGAISPLITPPNIPQQEKSLSPIPMRRERSSAISSDAYLRRRSGAVTGAIPTPIPSGAAQEGGSESPSPMVRSTPLRLPVPRVSSSAIKGQRSMGKGAALPDISDDSEDSLSLPIIQPHSQYIKYDRDRRLAAKPPMSAYDAYDPFPHPGSHQQYGVPGAQGYEYPSTSALGQSQTGYTAQHPSEEFLPRAQDDIGRRAVYGAHLSRPIPGVGGWEQYFGNWKDVGQQYKIDIPKDEALTQDEMQFAQKYGFSFVRELGRGSYGSVWLVLATKLFTEPVPQGHPIKYVPKRLACKVLSLKKFEAPNATLEVAVQKLVREADLHKQLNHRNIVKCEHIFHIHDQTTGFPFVRLLMLMELCDGDLKDLLIKQKKFDERQAMDMLNDISDALQYMHVKNICHFDIKIHNIMYVNERGGHFCYKLADFGISKKYVSEKVAKHFGGIGTRLYMAPELQRLPKGLSESKPTDVYSLGCVLAEVLTGRGKFRQLLRDLQDHGPTPQVFGKWKLGLICVQLIHKMTDENPKNRPTISQVRQDPWFSEN